MNPPPEDLSPVKQALLTLQRQQERIHALEQAARQPVAIIGMGLRFPGGADTPDAFWQLLAQGTDAVTPVPPQRWDAEGCYAADADMPGRTTSRHGAFCADVDRFDAPFFRISPLEARAMDPQQRLLLEVAWEALENANVVPGDLYGSGAGVFVGVSTADYFSRQQAQAAPEAINAYYVSGGALSVVAGRLSYLLGLQGPSLSVDTACSSSLTALHLACQSLRGGGCRVALAGGVGLLLTPEPGIAFSKARMLAPDGHCKTFDAGADGYVRGEGCAVLVLKRLADAQADGDRILAVVRGTATNQNGASGGLTVPSGTAQEAVIRQALADAGATPDEIDYVEAHGTGTALGDPIELRALGQVFASAGRDRPLLVGSVKTNIGHLEAAAGMAGVAKVALALQHHAIPAHLHLHQPTPHFPWADFPLQVPTALRAWPAHGSTRLAGVSSFGFAGSNAHVVLAAPPPPPPPAPGTANAAGLCLLPLSARSPAALAALARRYRERLLGEPAPELAAFCQTAQRCRTHFEHRLVAISASAGDMAALLAGVAPADVGSLLGAEDGTPLAKAARSWLAAEPVDWHAVDPVRRARLVLPTYAFQRERYWYDQAPAIAAATPTRLLDQRLPSPFLRALFQTRLREGAPAFLAEHRVAGRIVVAAAHWTAMMLEALDALTSGDGISGLADVQFLRPAVLAEGRHLTVQLGIDAADGSARLRIASTDGDNTSDASWTQHVLASIATAATARAGASGLDAARNRCGMPADPADIYSHADATGISLGPQFRPLRALHRGAGEVVAELAGAFGPGLLDGCFQAALAMTPHLPAATLVPFAIRRLHWHARPATPRVWCHASSDQTATGGGWLCDLRLFDDDGRLCLEMLGFEARAADPTSFAAGPPPAWHDWLYQVEWQQAPACQLEPISALELEQWIDRPAVDACGDGLRALDVLAAGYARQALHALGIPHDADRPAADLHGIAPRHERLLRRLLQLAALPASQPSMTAQALARQHPAIAGELALLRRCGESLPQVLRGTLDPLELLFPDGDSSALAALYGESAAARCMNTLLARSLARAVATRPAGAPLRVLEIGAGTGASTAAVLAALAGRALAYTFSDVSPHFAPAARERFAGAPLIFRVLDIERDPLAQGLEAASFDVVLAANVLHATRDLEASLRHARQLLAPGGLLALLEGIAPRPWLDLVFGLTDGWWRFEDHALRPDHPLLAPAQWQSLLQRCGFDGGELVSPDRTGSAGLAQAVILAQVAPPAPCGRWLLLADSGGCGAALARQLRAQGVTCALVLRPDVEDTPAGWRRLLATHAAAGPIAHVLHLWSLDTDEPESAAADCASLLHLLQALNSDGAPADPQLSLVVGASEDAPAGVMLPAHAPLWALAKVAVLEHPQLQFRRIDIGALRGSAAAAALMPHAVDAKGPPEAGLRDGRVYLPRLARYRLAAPQATTWRPDGACLVTGAFGELGLLLAETLAEDGARELLLLGRRPPGAAARARLDALERQGVRVRALATDVGDARALGDAVAQLEAGGSVLRGVFHLAGVLDDALLADQNAQRLGRALSPKVQGAWNLHLLTAGRQLARFVLYSSAAPLLGSAGQTSHAAANAFLDALALHRHAAGLPALSIGWSAWAEVGAAARLDRGDGGDGGAPHLARWQRQGFAPLPPQQATATLRALLAEPTHGHIGVVAIDWSRLLQHRASDPLLAGFAFDRAVTQVPAAATAAPTAGPPRGLAQALRDATDAAGRAALLERHLQAEVAHVLGWPAADAVDPRSSFIELGLDSLTSMELRNRLQSALGLSLPTTLTFEHPSVRVLALHLAAATAGETAAASGPEEVAGNDLDAMLLALLQPEQR